ncbi:phosphoribosyl transferase [Bifidobacterium parmae]|uniref:Phosphoribosyl transferase n=2 Tax=Bifidobacterium parmae TaxID=361854 RepID=A0A2N5J5H0_9BIFI|nr:phosphoribosyl transferase [Bifidobacterium parmae]
MRAGTLLPAMMGLVLPRGCAGCGMPDDVLCPACRSLFDDTVIVPSCVPGVPVVACATYRGAVRRAILAWKDHGDEECDRPFSQALCALADRMPVEGVIGGEGDARRIGDRDVTLIVPAPSSQRSSRRRGRRHMRPLARAIAAACRARGVPARAEEALASHTTGGRSVEMKGRAGRAARVGGSGIVVTRPSLVRGRRVILVDDIVTSGATMRACAAALRTAGARVVACLALAATPRYDASAT